MRNTDSYRYRARAVVLASIMVISMVAVGFAGVAGSAAAQSHEITADDFDRVVTAGNTVYQGQTILVSVATVDESDRETVELRRVDDGSVGTLVAAPSVVTYDGTPYARIDTTNRDTDTYVLTTAPSGTSLDDLSADPSGDDGFGVSFEVVVQDLTVAFDEDDVGNVAGDAEVDFEIDSDIRNRYAVEVTADGLDDEELEAVFTQDPDASWTAERTAALDRSELYADRASSGEYVLDSDAESIVLLDAEGEHTLNFTDVDTGTYEFEVTVYDTTGSDSASIVVVVGDEGVVRFVDRTVDGTVGSVVEIELRTVGGVDEASVVVGDAADIGYQLNATVDFDGEDRATLRFNTYVAGDETLSEPGAVNAVLIEDGENDAVVTAYAESGAVDGLLDAGDYELAVRAGATDVDDFDAVLDDPDGVGSLFLEERSTDAWTLWTAPGGADAIDELADGDDVVDAVEAGVLTETDRVAHDDYLVHELDATGVSGILAATGERDAVDRFAALFGDEFAHQPAGVNSFDLRVRETRASAGPNVALNVQDVLAGVDAVIVDEERNRLYVVQDMRTVDVAAGPRAGGELDAETAYEFEVRFRNDDYRLLEFDPEEDEDVSLADVREQLETEYDLLEREFAFDADPYDVTNAADVVFTGTTTVAPGSEFDARVRSTGDTSPRFNINQAFAVDGDREWATDAFDLSETSVGDTFTLSLRNTGAADRPEVDGNVVETVDEGTPTETEEPADTPEGTPEDTPEETPEGTPGDTPEETPDETDDDTPGFGIVVALVALVAAALFATRRLR